MNLNRICLIFFILAIVFSNKTFAASFDDLSANISKDYLEWLESEDKELNPMPRMYEVMSEYESDTDITSKKLKDSLFDQDSILGANSKAENIARYFLGDEINLEIKHQKSTTECWAFSILSSLETNMAKTRGITNANYSERHMDYATTRTFLNNQINEKGFKRELAGGGTPDIALAYLTSGMGPVKEEVMPFIDSEAKIDISELTFPEPETKVNSYVTFKSILKEQKNGKTYYYDKTGEELTMTEVTAIRNQIKNHIMKYGAIAGFTAGAQYEYYSNPNNFIKSGAYYCDTLKVRYDHAITIVGWDDNYSKENFNENHRPTSDGAYIVLNSYGKESFDDGYIYISYEDAYIEYYLYGITSTEDAKDTNIYQYDPYGCVSAIGSTSYSSGYGANVFKRENVSKKEFLTEVSFNLVTKTSVEVYINPNGDNLNNLIKVGEYKKDLDSGYHTVEFDPVELTGEKFAVVVKYINAGEGFFFGTENSISGSVYEYASAEKGQSYISFDGNYWEDLTSLSINGLNMKTANICIKAFTEYEKEIIPEEPEEIPTTPEEDKKDEPEIEPEKPEVKPDEPKEETPTTPEEDKKDEVIIETENNKDENKDSNEKNESSIIITVDKKENTKEDEKTEENNKQEDTKDEENTKEEDKNTNDEIKEKNIATIVVEVNKGKDDISKEEDKSEEDTKEENKAEIIVTVGNGKNIFSNWYNILENSKKNNIANNIDVAKKIFSLNDLLKFVINKF